MGGGQYYKVPRNLRPQIRYYPTSYGVHHKQRLGGIRLRMHPKAGESLSRLGGLITM